MVGESWIRAAETARTARRRRGSSWPAAWPGPAGAVQAKDWLIAGRNPLTWVRLAALAAGVIALIMLKPWVSALALETRRVAAPAVAFGGALFILGEMMVTLLPSERDRLALLAVSGATAGRVLLGKALAAAPALLLTSGLYGLSGWAFALDAGVLALMWQGFWAATGMTAILLGAGALEAPRPVAALPVDEAYQHLFEQVPTGLISQAGLLVAAAFGAAQIWGGPLLAAAAWLAPVTILIAGWLRLDRFLRAGHAR